MSRQLQIAGTERKSQPEIEEAHQNWMELRDERKAMKSREKQKLAELIAIMHSHKIKKHVYPDDDGVVHEVRCESETKVHSRKIREEEPKVPNGEPGTDGMHPGLIEHAMKAQQDETHAEVDDEGNVVVPETSTPKRKAKHRK